MKQFNKRKKIKINKENRSEFNFKEVALTKMAKRQLLVTLFSILGVTIISLGSAYAVFTSVSKSKDYNVIKVGTLNIDFGTDSSNTINLSGQYPMSDEEGLKLTPYTFTIKNTGTLTADYEVFIQDDTDMISQDNCSGSQLNKDYIRYKLDTGTPANLSSIAGSNYKIATGSLEPSGSVTYTLYVWIREGVGNDVLSKHYHGKIVVNGVNVSGDPVSEIVLENVGDNGSTYDDGEDTFITGTNPNNYIWYSGKLWRAVSVNNEAKTTKLVTQSTMSPIYYSNGSSAFEESYAKQWLNDESVDGFLYNLREPDKFIVTDAKWNATENISSGKPDKTTIVESPVGLLNSYEYVITGGNDGYLHIGHNWFTLTPASATTVITIRHTGSFENYSATSGYGIRPSVNLKTSIRIVGGDGTANNPYRLSGDNDSNLSGTLLNTRYSGEYIRLGVEPNNLYQIVSHENGIGTKVTTASPLSRDGTGYNSQNAFINGAFLENETYLTSDEVNMIEDSSTWYIGTMNGAGSSYKLAKYIDADMSGYVTSNTAKVGLLRVGELITVSGRNIWAYTNYDSSYVLLITSTSQLIRSGRIANHGTRPAFNLKSNVIITGGDGTLNSPFEIQLGS